MNILGNYTYEARNSGKSMRCIEGKLVRSNWQILKFEIRVSTKTRYCSNTGEEHQFPMIVRWTPSKMKLVGCGRKGVEDFVFAELINVFDRRLWLIILIAMISVSITLQFARNIGVLQRASIFVGYFQILVEQGDPFPPRVMKHHRCRWIVGTSLLTGIILSNAYKNKNVYAMITPKRDIPYRYLDELIKDNFSIFTRSSDPVFDARAIFLTNTSNTIWTADKQHISRCLWAYQ